MTKHRADAALAAFRRAVELRPEHAAAWKAIGVILASQSDYEGAEPAFRNACERQPALTDACLYYGRTLYLLDRFASAIQVLRQTVRNEPNNAEAYRLLGLSLEGSGQRAEADSAFQQAMRLPFRGPADEDPGIDYGVFLFRQGQLDQALKPLEDVVRRHPNAGRARLELGCVLLALDRVDFAATQLEQAVALQPNNARAHLLLGKAYLRLGKAEAADEHLRQGSRTVK
jgi:superkiller protein 3